MSERFAVIDTETTWTDDVMSIGVVISDDNCFEMLHVRYHLIVPHIHHSAMYSDALYINGLQADKIASRFEVMSDVAEFLDINNVERVFAYNANFDRTRLPELGKYNWFHVPTGKPVGLVSGSSRVGG